MPLKFTPTEKERANIDRAHLDIAVQERKLRDFQEEIYEQKEIIRKRFAKQMGCDYIIATQILSDDRR